MNAGAQRAFFLSLALLVRQCVLVVRPSMQTSELSLGGPALYEGGILTGG